MPPQLERVPTHEPCPALVVDRIGAARPDEVGTYRSDVPARRLTPPLPRLLAPGGRRRGALSGEGRLAPVGGFQASMRTGGRRGLPCVTDRAVCSR